MIKYNDIYNHDRKKSDDMVNHPKHYKAKNGLETIDVIDAFTEGLEGYEAAYVANILKYTCRFKNKNGVEDLKKARWYMDRLIAKIEAKERFAERNAYKVHVETRTLAEELLDYLTETSRAYNVVTLADLQDMLGQTYTHISFNLGWVGENAFKDARIERYPYSYVLILPAFVDLDN